MSARANFIDTYLQEMPSLAQFISLLKWVSILKITHFCQEKICFDEKKFYYKHL